MTVIALNAHPVARVNNNLEDVKVLKIQFVVNVFHVNKEQIVTFLKMLFVLKKTLGKTEKIR
jgi:hypothetical protein